MQHVDRAQKIPKNISSVFFISLTSVYFWKEPHVLRWTTSFSGKICIEEWLPIANCLVFNPNDTVVYGPAESLRVILTINASDGAPYSSNAVGFTVGITNKFHYLDDRANAEVMPGYSYDLGIKKLIIDDKSGTTDCIPTGELKKYLSLKMAEPAVCTTWL